MPTRDIIVIGASAGGIEPLQRLLSHLPGDFPAAILIVVHIPPDTASSLPLILSQAGPLPADHCPDGAPIRPGHICIAPPDHHLLLRDNAVRLGRGPRENNARPAVDALFRSAALCCGQRVIGIVLSGALDDGAAGLAAIKSRGGIAIAQDPATAAFPGMPTSAIAAAACDYIAAPGDIPTILDDLVHRPFAAPPLPTPSPQLRAEVEMAESAMTSDRSAFGASATYGCPECGGTLWEMRPEPDTPVGNGGALNPQSAVRFRCRVGHAYSSESLVFEQGHAVETALWAALRALEERRALAARLAERVHPRAPRLAENYRRRAEDARRHADILRTVLQSTQDTSQPQTDSP